MGRETRRVFAIALKDLTAERRTKANFNGVLFFAVLILLMFGFALGPDADALRDASAGVLWLTVLFGGVLAFNRSYEMELENGSLDALLMYPGDRKSIYLGKLLANLTFVLVVEVLLVPMAIVLYNLPVNTGMAPVLLVLLLGTIGFVTLGTFYAAMASRVRAREVLLPLLLFPMLVPLLVAAVQATGALMQGDVMGDSSAWFKLLVVYDVIFLAASYFAFEYVIEE